MNHRPPPNSSGANHMCDKLAEEHSMSQEYIEAILVWTPSGSSPTVNQWLADRGLQAMPMRRGLLISGDGQRFEAAFQVNLDSQSLPAILPIPAEWRDIVSSITVPKPPEYHR